MDKTYPVKQSIFSLFIISIGLSLFSFKKVERPPGTVQIGPGFYFDKAEVTNFNWLEYTTWNKNRYGVKSEQYLNSLRDTSVWGSVNPDYVTFYHQHSAYGSYPAVGISYEQAVDFCHWRTNMVNLYFHIKQNKLEYHSDSTYSNVPQRYLYRLPTQEEWKSVASAGYNPKTLKKKNKKAINQVNTKNKFTEPSISGWTNTSGIYGLFGNVAEMVETKGISKGGSWKKAITELDVLALQHYTGPNNWLGFRCACEEL